MDTQAFVAGPLSVLCVVALVMGTASAAVIATTGSTPDNGAIPAHQHPSPESIINHLEEQGVDVTEVRTALENGDTETVQEWLEEHRPAKPDGAGRSPPDLTDPARQEEIITRLEAEGVDVTDVKTSLRNGDTEAVQAWLEEHRPAKPDGAGRSPPDLTDPARQEEILSRLEAEGVDISEVKTALENDDTDAVQAWLGNYFQNHRQARAPPDLTDPIQEQSIINRLEEQGVDVTGVEADLQKGDTTAVKTWLETYLHSHEGEMGFHHPPETLAVSQTGSGE